MKRNLLISLVAVLLLIVYAGCKKLETFPEVPAIEFRSVGIYKDVSGADSLSVITISFTDGDGDVGYHPTGNGNPYDDSLSVYYNNFIVALFQKVDGVWERDTVHDRAPFPGFSARIPYLTPEGNNKTLKGEISMDQFLPPIPNDTFRYEVYIYDRALHQSNTITTNEFVTSP